MLTTNPFVYRLICRARVFLILSGALYPLISCCIFLPKKKTPKKTEKCGATIILNNKTLSRIFIWEQVDDDTDDCA